MCVDAAAAPGCLPAAASGSADDVVCFWRLSDQAEDDDPTIGERASKVGSRVEDPVAPSPSSSGLLQRAAEARLSQQGCNDVAFSDDGRVLACAGWDGRVRLFSVPRRRKYHASVQLLANLSYHQSQVGNSETWRRLNSDCQHQPLCRSPAFGSALDGWGCWLQPRETRRLRFGGSLPRMTANE